MKARSDLEIVAALSGTKYAPIAEKLQREFYAVGITSRDKLHNAPLKVKTTHGADIYEVIEILKGDSVVEGEKVEGTINVMPLIPPATPKKGRK